jgi:hypothetical protein
LRIYQSAGTCVDEREAIAELKKKASLLRDLNRPATNISRIVSIERDDVTILPDVANL